MSMSKSNCIDSVGLLLKIVIEMYRIHLEAITPIALYSIRPIPYNNVVYRIGENGQSLIYEKDIICMYIEDHHTFSFKR